MAETKERRNMPRKTLTPKPDSEVEAPRESNGQAAARASQPASSGLPRRRRTCAAGIRPKKCASRSKKRPITARKQRGFEPGHELEDWIQAESEVMRRNGLR